MAMLGDIKKSQVGKDGLFSNKARNLTRQLNEQRDIANDRAIASADSAVQNQDVLNDQNIMANYSDLGGPISMRYTGNMSPFGNRFALGGDDNNTAYTVKYPEIIVRPNNNEYSTKNNSDTNTLYNSNDRIYDFRPGT